MLNAVQTVLKEPSTLNAVMFTVAALGGQVLNFTVRWLRGEVNCFISYFFREHWKLSLAAFVTNLIGIACAITLVDIASVKPIVAAATGLGLGFMADSIVNKGSRKEWTPEEREAKK